MSSPPESRRSNIRARPVVGWLSLDLSTLPIDLAGIAFVYRPDEGQNLPDLIVWKHVVNGWHRLLRDLAFDEFEERFVVAAEFPAPPHQGARHASTASAAVATLTPDLEIECLSGGDHFFLDGIRIQLLDRRSFRGRRWRVLGRRRRAWSGCRPRRFGLWGLGWWGRLLPRGLLILSARPSCGGLVRWHQRNTVLFENRSNGGLPVIDRRFKASLELPVALLHAHRNVEC